MLFSFVFAFLHCNSAGPSDAQIEGLIQVMTLEEKIGQMTQTTIGDFSSNGEILLDPARKAIITHKIGFLLNSPNGLNAPTRFQWNQYISQINSLVQETSLQIPVLYGHDAIHGFGWTFNFTSFPQELGMAATFNPDLVLELGKVTAYEARSCGIAWTFAPILDLGVDPRWPRLWEGFGEDPYLASQMGVAAVRGFQGIDANIDEFHVASCAKHYLGYSNPFSGKDRTPALLVESQIREYHLPSFQAAIEAGLTSVMVNSGLINGIPSHMNKFLLTDLLKEELGFEGVVLTDWGDLMSMWIRDRIVSSYKEAIKLGINAGIDVGMVCGTYEQFIQYLTELVNEGEVKVDRINDAVRRVLKLKSKLNLFDVPVTSAENYPDFGTFKNSSYVAASESITLLKNDGILPIQKGKKVLVTGPNSNLMRSLNGGWSYGWVAVEPPEGADRGNTILEAIRNVNGAENVVYVQSVVYPNEGSYYLEQDVGIDQAVEAASSVDYVILCLGEQTYSEKAGDLVDLSISNLQIELCKQLAKVGKPLILVLNQGRPRIITNIVDDVSAILMLYLPGYSGGDALADILFGIVNPSGKLPVSYPKYPHSLFNYHRKKFDDYNPLFEFGFGLSYTTFNYSNLVVSSNNQVINVSVTVQNTGNVYGKEAVQLYSSDLVASLSPDAKRLRKFKKIGLEPHESTTLEFQLTLHDLSFIDGNNKRITEIGDFEIQIANLKANLTLT